MKLKDMGHMFGHKGKRVAFGEDRLDEMRHVSQKVIVMATKIMLLDCKRKEKKRTMGATGEMNFFSLAGLMCEWKCGKDHFPDY